MKHIGNITFAVTVYEEVNQELIQRSKAGIFATIVTGFKPSTSLMMLSIILLSMLMILLSTLSETGI